MNLKATGLGIRIFEVGCIGVKNLRRILNVRRSGSRTGERNIRNAYRIDEGWVGENVLFVDSKQGCIVGDPITSVDGGFSSLERIPSEAQTGSEIVGDFVRYLGPKGRSFSVDADAVQIGKCVHVSQQARGG